MLTDHLGTPLREGSLVVSRRRAELLLVRSVGMYDSKAFVVEVEVMELDSYIYKMWLGSSSTSLEVIGGLRSQHEYTW